MPVMFRQLHVKFLFLTWTDTLSCVGCVWNCGSAAGSLSGQTLRLFFADNFGEDLLFNIADGSIFYWDATNGTSTRAVALTGLTGASDVPTVARKILVSDVDRHVIVFGTNPIGSATLDPLLIRFGSQESLTDFTPTATNTAGDLRLSKGSEIITAIQTSHQTHPTCLLYTSPSPRDGLLSRMPSSA